MKLFPLKMKKMYNYFLDAFESLQIEPFIKEKEIDSNPCDAIKAILSKYIVHPSIQKIRKHFISTESFLSQKLQHKNPKESICGKWYTNKVTDWNKGHLQILFN